MDVVGYADRWSIRPGETLTVFADCRTGGRVEADVVRLLGGAGDGDPYANVEETVASLGGFDGMSQPKSGGSYGVVSSHDRFDDPAGVGVEIAVMPTYFGAATQTILARSQADKGFALQLEDAYPVVRVAGKRVMALSYRLQIGEWYRLHVRIDTRRDEVTLEAEPLLPGAGRQVWAASGGGGRLYAAAVGRPYSIASRIDGQAVEFFDGKIEAPSVFGGAGSDFVVARWDFSRDLACDVIRDVSGGGHDCKLVNGPLRGVTGHNWTPGGNLRRHPDRYAAIHFHSDDLADVGWTPSLAWKLPDTLRSGFYAVRLRKGDSADRIPFFVRPAATPTARIAFLVPTATYLAYANDHQAFDKARPERSIARPIVLQPQDIHLHLNRDLGLSLYDRHLDGSGVHYSSRHRPVLTMRPAYCRWDGADGLGHRWFALDLQLVGWLIRSGLEFDVVTDEDLDREGAELLSGYRVVLTGNQPEYASARMLDALDAYVGGGGRLVYLGGNGFYWPVAFDPSGSGTIELRRGNDDAGPWLSAPGESGFVWAEQSGGTWRTCGRPPQRLTGVGFVAEGFTRSGGYERLPDSDLPKASFVFAGVESRSFGARGFSGGGAAGIELDRADRSLGTSPDALVLARAKLPSVFYSPCTLEVARGTQDLACGEIVLTPHANGAAVFATGSIAWIGALGVDGDRNDVSRITRNVIERFLDPAPLV